MAHQRNAREALVRAEAVAEEHDEPEPRSTLILMLLFLVLMVGIWGAMYLVLLGRAG